ncbi:MAG: penicillin-binding transpeptidase domain-containing protein [Pseudomonadota bacterium]
MIRRKQRREANAKRFRFRSVVVNGFFIAISVVLVGRAAHLQVLQQDFLQDEARKRHVREVTLSAHRGPIVDRNGEPMAVSTPVDSVWANPRLLGPAIDDVPALSRMIDVDGDQLLRRISRSADREFVYLRRHLPPARAANVMALDLPGVALQREYRRFYPAGEVVGHVLGFTNIDDQGQEGLEYAFDHWLAGQPGSKRVIKDEKGRVIEDVDSVRQARHGNSLVTSLDLRLQYLAYRELMRAIAEHDAESGSVVVLDIDTGEVLAMVNQPGYNPNDRSQFNASRYRNRAVTDILEPGSSIKPLIVAAALASNRFDAASVVDTAPGWIQVGPKKIEDKRNHGRLTLTEVIARSSNVGITKLAMQLEAEQLFGTLVGFGLGALTGSDFPGESSGLLSHYTHWRAISQATLAYGYGVSVTPLQLARAYAAIGGGGVLRPVTLVRQNAPVDGVQILEPEDAAAILSMMEQVVAPGGTGTKAAVPGYRIAGKTGTAWKFSAGGYSQNKYISIFAGVAPASAPELAVVVIVDEPSRDDYYGGDVAAPVFARIVAESLRLLAVTPDDLGDDATGYLVQADAR